MIKIPIEIGDIIYVGRFKNKRVVVKSIEYNEYGLPLINGRPLLTVRIEKLIPKTEGIKARWGRVWAVGPEQTDVKEGDWVCVAHGRWTRGVKVEDSGEEIIIRRIDNNDILIVSDYKPDGVYIPAT